MPANRKYIEAMAEDEAIRLQEENWERARGLFLLLGWGLGLWGWYRFDHEDLGSGALAVIVSLIFFALRWNATKTMRMTATSFWMGLAAGGLFLALYLYTALPSFYWGQDPAFWLAVHSGAVTEPVWSPLSYLLGEASSFIFASQAMSILPLLSAAAAAMGLFMAAQELLSNFFTEKKFNLFFVFVACGALGLSRPFWNSGTMGLGLVSDLGLLLFLLLRHLLSLEKKYAAISFFLLGLLWSIHPLWGLLGLLVFITESPYIGRIFSNLWPLFMGLSPYLWVFLRRGKSFFSWGGHQPFIELLKESRTLWLQHFQNDWSWTGAAQAFGWEVAALLALALALGIYNRMMGVATVSRTDFWIWLFSGLTAFLFYSDSTDYLGATSLWFVTGIVGFLSFSFERRVGRASGLVSKENLGLISLAGVLLTCALCWLPGQSYFRSDYAFPQQHVLNLVKGLGPQSVLVCDDPFEFNGALAARWMAPLSPTAFVLDKNYLDQRWYVAQWIEQEPQFFFSTIAGPTDLILKSVILDNRNDWQIQWSRPALPADWGELAASSAVLTQIFSSENSLVDPASFQYNYDLSPVPVNSPDLDPRAKRYAARYVQGFEAMGRQLLDQKRYSEAIHAYDRAARLDPSDQTATTALSQIYSQNNILEATQIYCETIVKSHPPEIDQLMKALDEAQSRQDATTAADNLEQIVKLNGELSEAQYQLSKIYTQQGRTQEAGALLASSIQINPQQVEAQLALGHSMEETGDVAKAEEAFRSVIAVDPQNKEAQVELWKLLNKPKS
jgi:tetratricopeptide (TPR) repeat protein